MKLLFLGVGNRDRADDGVGPLSADLLAKDEALKDLGVEVLPHSGEGASLMDLWQGADLVVVIDAMKSGAPLGSLRRFDAAQESLSSGVFRYSSHLFGLAEAVEMAKVLGSLPKKLIIYGIEGKEYSMGASMSPEVVTSMQEAIDKARKDFMNA